jgi:hypothetical protein
LTGNTQGKKTIIYFPSFPTGEGEGVKEFFGGTIHGYGGNLILPSSHS